MENLEALFKPLTINALAVPNRIVMGPMATCEPNNDGSPSNQTVAFFEARARGGVGLIIVSGVSTERAAREATFSTLRLDQDDVAEAYARLIEVVHSFGTKIFFEAIPGFGRMAKSGAGQPDLISASAGRIVIPEDRLPKGMRIPGGISTPMAREATLEEIEAIENETAASAVRCRMAGFDGIEIPAQRSYFLASFLSPTSNHRTDRYGGTVENRARILVNIATKMRALVGADYPIGLRILCNEYGPSAQGVEAFAALAAEVERAGIDYVAMVNDNSSPAEDGVFLRDGTLHTFRQALTVPIMLNVAHDPTVAAHAIAAGEADMTMLARPLLADPEYANKVRSRNINAIVRCTGSNHCAKRLVMKMPVRCEVNPRMGRESRRPGQLPPLNRLMKAPIEQAILALTNSSTVLGIIARLKTRS